MRCNIVNRTMNNDRSSKILLGGEEYELFLSTRASHELIKRYGSLEKLGERLSKSNFDDQLTEISWITALLANQTITINNLKAGEEEKKELLSAETIELLASPGELGIFSESIGEALKKGVSRSVESEDDSKEGDEKNAEVG